MTDGKPMGRCCRTAKPSSAVSRRRVLRGTALAAGGVLAGLAGCTTGVEEGPNPHVVRHLTDPDIDEVSSRQPVEVTALVANLGDPGPVQVVAETREFGQDEDAEPLDSGSVTVELDSDEQRELAFEVSVSPLADLLDTHAESGL